MFPVYLLLSHHQVVNLSDEFSFAIKWVMKNYLHPGTS
jgi:hypothetical protein